MFVDLVASDLDSVLFLDSHDQLEGINRVKAQFLAEQRGVVGDPVSGQAIESQAFDDQALQIFAEGDVVNHSSYSLLLARPYQPVVKTSSPLFYESGWTITEDCDIEVPG